MSRDAARNTFNTAALESIASVCALDPDLIADDFVSPRARKTSRTRPEPQ